jgi:hypothetical protein
VLAEIQPGLATPIAGIRWLSGVEWAEPYTGPIPLLAETGALPLVAASESVVFESAVLDVPQGPAGSIWDALNETAGIPILSRAALWRRDAVERRTAQRDGTSALSA